MEVVASDIPMKSLPAAIAEHEPDVAVINFSALRSPVQIHELSVAHPDARLVLLAQRPSPAECQQLLSFGATALLEKDAEKRDLQNTIHLASRGMHVLPRSMRDDRLAEMGPELLTAREAEVLELLQAGHSTAELALKLGVGVETVRTHVRNIFRKLGVSSRRELASR